MKRSILFPLCSILLVAIVHAADKTSFDPVDFIKKMPYHQVVKELALARCIALVSTEDTLFSLDAARTANAMREWMPFDIENADQKVNALIDKYKSIYNPSHRENGPDTKGVTLNCLRLYHSPDLDKLSREVIDGDPDHTWYQDNP
ncbi:MULTISPECIES: T6SS amidase immunity protein Tai4 family protein [unclassified Brenneria]|uniref:T6SS amidase immunity protein Tai4 family protein n=1 Tax=unclassified Brenneria TaxID=2634434 RepID=UPI0029C4ECE2|nr:MULTISPECIES: T6SS amidase immunity protein Tai4 family protein [unclassified Brenneria]MDX5627152.1 T6SS amidase immunity protein Tai4 family protein [Brenneria sp. L3-3Z]MDX5694693.1 T6SS amidase immunity protein Tai4 family protein [Brenneria sp. L4-2C]MEE3664274.1 T6SS amidase immunity protein Tai4 family protein [Brenneria sp. g21c3]